MPRQYRAMPWPHWRCCWLDPRWRRCRRWATRPRRATCAWSAHSDLQARSAYQPTIHRQGDRFIAYVGHHGGTEATPKPVNPLTGQPEFSGTSIIDVTDPAHPKYLHPSPRPGRRLRGRAAPRWCGCATARASPRAIRNAVYMLRVFGGQAHEIWNVADPTSPKLITPARWLARHPQEFLGMRHRHRLPGVGCARLAHPAHDPDLRSHPTRRIR